MIEIGALRKESDEDYVLVGNSCWITVGSLSVTLRKEDKGLNIYVYELDHEDEYRLTHTWLPWPIGAQGETN